MLTEAMIIYENARKENKENRAKALHNFSSSLEDLKPYEIEAHLELVKFTNDMISSAFAIPKSLINAD